MEATGPEDHSKTPVGGVGMNGISINNSFQQNETTNTNGISTSNIKSQAFQNKEK